MRRAETTGAFASGFTTVLANGRCALLACNRPPDSRRATGKVRTTWSGSKVQTSDKARSQRTTSSLSIMYRSWDAGAIIFFGVLEVDRRPRKRVSMQRLAAELDALRDPRLAHMEGACARRHLAATSSALRMPVRGRLPQVRRTSGAVRAAGAWTMGSPGPRLREPSRSRNVRLISVTASELSKLPRKRGRLENDQKSFNFARLVCRDHCK